MVGVSRAGGSPRSPRMGIVLNLLSLSFLSFLIAGAAAQASTKLRIVDCKKNFGPVKGACHPKESGRCWWTEDKTLLTLAEAEKVALTLDETWTDSAGEFEPSLENVRKLQRAGDDHAPFNLVQELLHRVKTFAMQQAGAQIYLHSAQIVKQLNSSEAPGGSGAPSYDVEGESDEDVAFSAITMLNGNHGGGGEVHLARQEGSEGSAYSDERKIQSATRKTILYTSGGENAVAFQQPSKGPRYLLKVKFTCDAAKKNDNVGLPMRAKAVKAGLKDGGKPSWKTTIGVALFSLVCVWMARY